MELVSRRALCCLSPIGYRLPMTSTVTVVRNRDRYTKCASCRAMAVALVLTANDRPPFASTCLRHKELWLRRAAEAVAA